MIQSLSKPLLLRGKVVHPDGSARDRYVLVREGRVASVTRHRPPLVEDAVHVETGHEDWIFPGLLDLHTHSTYNLLPLWSSPAAPFDNRFGWRSDAGYKHDVRETSKLINTNQHRDVVAVFAELQAVAGGTTVLQESKDLDEDLVEDGGLLLCRDTANAADLGLDPRVKVFSVVDLFRPGRRTGAPEVVGWTFDAYESALADGTLQAILPHLAEGRSGLGHDRGPDAYSRAEFEAFIAHPAFADPERVRSSAFAIIHCSGIDTTDPRHLEFLLKRDISVIWSPVSNLLLYGDTLDVEALLEAGVNVALGSDWSPSGSKHVWDEAKLARTYLNAIGAKVSNQQLFQMVTTNAGRCLGARELGRIEEGSLGDFFILRSPLESDDPLEVFFHTTDRHVRATVIGGRPVYGDRALLRQFGVDLQGLPSAEGSAVTNKAVHLPASVNVQVDRDITRLEELLKALPEPIKRSNLLASSDTPYRRRIKDLRKRIVDLGWSVQQWRKKGPSATPGQVAVRPSAVRVWRGFRAQGLSSSDFRKKLGTCFVPAAVQTQVPLGMTAYLPAVLPDDCPENVPDEIALVFYESQSTYGRCFDSTGGRVYGLLHQTVFAPSSTSGFPKKLRVPIEPDTPYYLFDQATDWQRGHCHVVVCQRPSEVTAEQMRRDLTTVLGDLQANPPDSLDGAIVVASDEYFVFWEHWTDEESASASRADEVASVGLVVFRSNAEPRRIPPDFLASFDGVEIEGGETLNLQFVRRKVFRR